MRQRRLLSVGHSYCVTLNRRLGHELARIGARQWDVTVAGPKLFRGDLMPITLAAESNEPCRVERLSTHCAGRIHVMLYGSKLRRLLAEGWDVIHAWEEPYILAGGQIAWWTPPSTQLVYATFQNIEKRYPPPFSWIERYALERAAGWLAFGHTIEETQIRRPCYKNRPRRVIPLGVDIDHFRPSPAARANIRRELGWDEPGPHVVGFLGRFIAEKGLLFLTRVLDQLVTPWRALFVGGGPLEEQLKSWGKGHGSRVRIVTGVAHDLVPTYLNAMDLLCAPSQTTPHWREQLGRMLIEGFACGIPVIASRSGEIPFVVNDAGVLLDEQDEREWSLRLSDLLESPNRRSELSALGRHRACEKYAWPLIAQQHLKFFEELIDGQQCGHQ